MSLRRLTSFGVGTLGLWAALSGSVQAASLDVMLNDGDKEDIECGLASEVLEARARTTLRSVGLSASSKSAAYLWIQRVTMARDGRCYAHLTLMIKDLATLSPGAQFKPLKERFFFPVCEWSYILAGERSAFSDRLMTAMEGGIKECLGTLNYK